MFVRRQAWSPLLTLRSFEFELVSMLHGTLSVGMQGNTAVENRASRTPQNLTLQIIYSILATSSKHDCLPCTAYFTPCSQPWEGITKTQGSPYKLRAYRTHRSSSYVHSDSVGRLGQKVIRAVPHARVVHVSTTTDRSRALQSGGQQQLTMRTLLVDNYDSYTYNLYQAIFEVTQGEG